jgi:hypothetical protein
MVEARPLATLQLATWQICTTHTSSRHTSSRSCRNDSKEQPCRGETPTPGMKVVAFAVATRPGQGRRLLVPRARKKTDPSTAPGAPHCCPTLGRSAGARQANFHSCGTPRCASRGGAVWRCCMRSVPGSMCKRTRRPGSSAPAHGPLRSAGTESSSRHSPRRFGRTCPNTVVGTSSHAIAEPNRAHSASARRAALNAPPSAHAHCGVQASLFLGPP